jgi:hypothetical protein
MALLAAEICPLQIFFRRVERRPNPDGLPTAIVTRQKLKRDIRKKWSVLAQANQRKGNAGSLAGRTRGDDHIGLPAAAYLHRNVHYFKKNREI